jgi:hypothetical protein
MLSDGVMENCRAVIFAAEAKEAPNSNIQAPEKLQTPNINLAIRAPVGAWHLVLLWMLEVEVWSFLSSPSDLSVGP